MVVGAVLLLVLRSKTAPQHLDTEHRNIPARELSLSPGLTLNWFTLRETATLKSKFYLFIKGQPWWDVMYYGE